MNIERGKILTVQEALLRIAILKQQAQVMGAQDYEPAAFGGIEQDLQAGKIRPEEALKMAQEILNGKQDYH